MSFNTFNKCAYLQANARYIFGFNLAFAYKKNILKRNKDF